MRRHNEKRDGVVISGRLPASKNREPILILAFVVTTIGGIGSIRGAFLAALLIGIVDTFGRVLLPPALGSMVIFILMATILAFRPQGLFPVQN
jgi:branched-chain amino acid transport system permease protein